MTTLIIGINAKADDVVYLDKNKQTPFSGYLFSEQKEKETRLKLIEIDFTQKKLDLTTKILDEQQTQIGLLEQRVDNLKTQNNTLSKDLFESRNVSFWQNALYFLTGAVITGAISYGVVKAVK